MFQRYIDDLRVATGTAARQSFFVVGAAVSLFITTSFVCAAAFVFVLQRYGLFEACLTGAAVFFVVTLLAAGSYMAMKQTAQKRLVKDTKAAAQSFVPDPMMVAAGLQVVRAIGFRRLVPIVAIAGLALGLIAARSQTAGNDDENDPGET